MLDTIHRFLWDTQPVWAVVGGAGFLWSFWLYYRAISRLVPAEQPRRRRTRQLAASPEVLTPPEAKADPRAETETSLDPATGGHDGLQQDLLQQLPEEADTRAAGNQAPAASYGVDQKARTRFAIQRQAGAGEAKPTPAEAETEAMERPEGGHGGVSAAISGAVIERNEVAQAEAASQDLSPEQARAEGDELPGAAPSLLDTLAEDDAGLVVRNEATSPTPATEPPTERAVDVDAPTRRDDRRNRRLSAEELLRRATRMEELGFHIGIETHRLRTDPDKVSDNEKRQLLAAVSRAEAAAAEQRTDTRVAEGELDDILAKLDAALTETFDQTPATDNAPTPTEAPAESGGAPDAGPGEGPDTAPAPTAAASTEPASTGPTTGPAAADLDAALAAAFGNDPEEDADRDPVTTDTAANASEAETPPAAPKANEATPPARPAKEKSTRRRRRRKKKSGIPDWARADTFDEEGDDPKKPDDDRDADDGKQLDLFGS